MSKISNITKNMAFFAFVLSIMMGVINTVKSGDDWEIVATCPFPHFFTQGLEVMPGAQQLLISAGWYKVSKVSLVDFSTGSAAGVGKESKCSFEEIFSTPLNLTDFGEGATRLDIGDGSGARIYVLTWKQRKVLVYREVMDGGAAGGGER